MHKTIAIGARGTYYPKLGQQSSMAATVIRVWSDTCVNLAIDGDTMAPTSVLVVQADAEEMPGGHFFVPDAVAAPAADDPLEAAIVAAGANVAPRVTPADIEAAIVAEHFFTARHGVQGALMAGELTGSEQRAYPHVVEKLPQALGMLTFCVLTLRNGFTVSGESACASPENFKPEIGERIARENAVAKVWPLLGYELRSRLAHA